MATAVLRSHDILQNRFGPRSLHSSNPSPNSRFNNNASRCRRRKRSPSGGNRRSSRDNLPSSPPPSPPQSSSKGLVMGQVKILKRGEELKPQMFVVGCDGGDSESDLCSTDRLGPDPVVLQKEVRVSDLYAGSTSQVSSPSPSELPFPAALIRIHVMQTDLRKLLKI